MIDVIRDAWPWLIPAFLLGLLSGWIACSARRPKPVGLTHSPGLSPEALARGSAVLGIKVRLNDLRVIEGIGPKIERLMNDDGIRTWDDLARARVSRLEEILDEAGPKYQMHVPSTWPQQAQLLTEAKWEEFKDLTDRLKGGR